MLKVIHIFIKKLTDFWSAGPFVLPFYFYLRPSDLQLSPFFVLLSTFPPLKAITESYKEIEHLRRVVSPFIISVI
jgi:hypothetical protein